MRGQDLQGNVTVHGELAREVYLAHAATADQLANAEAAQRDARPGLCVGNDQVLVALRTVYLTARSGGVQSKTAASPSVTARRG